MQGIVNPVTSVWSVDSLPKKARVVGESGGREWCLVWKFDGEGGGAPVSGPAWGDKHEGAGRSASKLWRSCLELEEKGDSSGGVTGKEKY